MNDVDGGSFTPVVLSSTGGMGPRMKAALKNLATRLSDKSGENYSQVITLLRARFCMSLLRSAVVCLRGTRSRRVVSAENVVMGTTMSYAAAALRL